MTAWSTASALDAFACLCCREPHIHLLSDPQSLSLTQRVAGIGPILVVELVVGSDVELHCGELCTAYRVNVPRSGRVESVHRDSSLAVGPGVLPSTSQKVMRVRDGLKAPDCWV
jgi:hypothetical protein